MPASQKRESKAVYFRRDPVQLEEVRATHAGDQLLRLFAERIEFLNLVQILCQRVTFRVRFELLTQSF